MERGGPVTRNTPHPLTTSLQSSASAIYIFLAGSSSIDTYSGPSFCAAPRKTLKQPQKQLGDASWEEDKYRHKRLTVREESLNYGRCGSSTTTLTRLPPAFARW